MSEVPSRTKKKIAYENEEPKISVIQDLFRVPTRQYTVESETRSQITSPTVSEARKSSSEEKFYSNFSFKDVGMANCLLDSVSGESREITSLETLEEVEALRTYSLASDPNIMNAKPDSLDAQARFGTASGSIVVSSHLQ